MDINRTSLNNQQSNLHPTNTENNYSYIQTIVNYIVTTPNTVINTATSLFTRAIGYFKNELISANELEVLCRQQDQASAIQQIESIISQYSYSRCRDWLYNPLSNQGKTPLEFLNENFGINNRYKIIETIVHIMEQKYKSNVENATPLGWVDLQNPNNNPNVLRCCINCSIFNIINSVYINSSNDDDLLDLLYCYENYPHVINYSSSSNSIIKDVTKIIWHVSQDPSKSEEELEKLKIWLRVLKNNPYDPKCTSEKLEIRKSYATLIHKLKYPANKHGLLDHVINHAVGLKKQFDLSYSKVKFDLEFQICKVIEELVRFLLEDMLVQTTELNIKSFLTQENFEFIEYLANNGKFPFCKKALTSSP